MPRFVLDEVQRLADSSDALRRTRGRRGLEILARMRKTGTTPVQVIDEDVPGTPEVDSKLVALAKRDGRAVLTNDLNLNRIADLQGVRVLNVNSLANAVKPALLPGEDLRVRVIQPGKDAGQGVGYLDDGTMVVVEGGAKSIDAEVDVTVTRVLQTVAGRMVFAHPRQALSADRNGSISGTVVGATLRSGLGTDGHSFGPGDGLRLGGIEIAGAPRLHGHSDGDAALHALAGALLGAAALGDLGGHPSRPTTGRRAASPARTCSCGVRARLADGRLARRSRSTSRSARDARASPIICRRCASPIAELLGAGDRRGQRQGIDRQSFGRRRGRSRDRGRGDRHGRPAAVAMTIQLRDTLTGEVRPLDPIEPGHVRVYSCGPTVYGPAHIGNFRSFLFADLLVRYLRYRGLRVTWVMNITDVDDKIIRGATQAGVSIGELADRWLERFLTDVAALRLTRPDVLPRATEHIDRMVELIQTLLDRGHAYRTDDGSIFFRIASWPSYGRLARLDPDQLRVGERVEADEYGKDDVRDFALWKGPKAGEPSWDTPIGAGRPGWHVECSAMSMAYLGAVVRHPHGRRRPDLPAPRGRDRPERGRDGPALRADVAPLRPPPAGWREDGQVDVGNIARVVELLERGVSPRALRYALIAVHYRQSLEYTDASLDAATAAIARLDALVAALESYARGRGRTQPISRKRSTTRAAGSRRRSTTT